MAKLKTTRSQLPTQFNLPSIFKSRSIAVAVVILSQTYAGNSFGCDKGQYEVNGTCYTEVTAQQSDGGSTSNSVVEGIRGAIKDRKGTNSDNKNSVANSADGKCAKSKMIDGSFQCDTTYNWIDNAQLINQVGQAAGSATIGVTNQLGAIKAQNAGTQSAVMEASAKSQENAGLLQTTLGLTNAAMGIYQIQQARKHDENAKQIKSTMGDLRQDGTNIDTAAEANQRLMNAVTGANQQDAVDAAAQARAGDGSQITHADVAALQKKLRSGAQATMKYGKEAEEEQNTAQRAAMAAGVRSVIVGTQMTLSGALAIGAAKQAKEMAGKLSDVTGNNYQLTSINPDTGTALPTSTTALSTGTASDPAVAATDPNAGAGDVPKIDTPTNPDNADNGPGAGPMAGSFQPGSTKGAGGGGSGGGIGVGSMSPAKAEQEQTGPRMADSRSNTAYSQGGGAGYAAAGGGVSADKSADLGFLANLLPKPQDEMGKNGILDYGTAGRSPASMAPYSFLGKDVNIFQRISDRTTTKLKSGDVGGSNIGGS